MCALTWRSRRGAILALGALTWATALFVTIVVPQATDPEALTAASGWGPAIAVLLLGAGAFRFARPARRSDIAAVLVDAGAVLVALVWLLWKIQPGPEATWTDGTALLWVGACTAALALALVAHASDHAPRMVSGGVFAVAFAGAALVAANPTDLPGWWIIPCTLGFVLVTFGALAGTVLIPDRRANARLWAQLLPVAPAAIAVWVALTHDDHVTPLGRWTLVAVIAAALLRQTVVSARGHLRVRYLERTLGSFRHDAEHDPLTGLANRALFNQRIDRSLELARRRSLAVLFLDLDDFKTINDTLGHGAGDELLVAVAQRLRATVRAEDTVARLGGDEFGILLNGLDGLEDAQRSARRILDALQPPFAVGGAEMRIGTSIGLAPVAARSTTSQLLREADMALYDAKEHGKNQFRCFSWTMQRDARDRFELQAELRQAIDREELLIYYQPIVDLPTGRVAGFEALARWNHSTRGVMLPDRFIPLAEELGVIHALGLVVLRAACAQLGAWDATFPDAPDWYIAVNVAVQQFDSPDLLTDVSQVLDESSVDPGRIVLEVTEGSVMEDPEHVLVVLQQLREPRRAGRARRLRDRLLRAPVPAPLPARRAEDRQELRGRSRAGHPERDPAGGHARARSEPGSAHGGRGGREPQAARGRPDPRLRPRAGLPPGDARTGARHHRIAAWRPVPRLGPRARLRTSDRPPHTPGIASTVHDEPACGAARSRRRRAHTCVGRAGPSRAPRTRPLHHRPRRGARSRGPGARVRRYRARSRL